MKATLAASVLKLGVFVQIRRFVTVAARTSTLTAVPFDDSHDLHRFVRLRFGPGDGEPISSHCSSIKSRGRTRF